MILKNKQGPDLYIADGLIDIAEVLVIENLALDAGRTTQIRFKPETEKKNIRIRLSIEQHNQLIEELNKIQSIRSDKPDLLRKLKLNKETFTPTTACLNES